MPVPGARLKISDIVTSWPGVSAATHRFGGTELRLGTRELGHIHGDDLVDLPFPKKVRDEIVPPVVLSRIMFCRVAVGSVFISTSQQTSNGQWHFCGNHLIWLNDNRCAKRTALCEFRIPVIALLEAQP